MATEYTLSDYGQMVDDHVRIDAYRDALAHVITPDSTIVDIGSGIGVFALLAAQLGAAQIYAIEPSDVISLGRHIAIRNGYANQIEFIHAVAENTRLPTKVDIIVSELRGVLPLFEGHIPTIIHAREHWLKPNGALIPEKDTIWAAVIDLSNDYHKIASPWLSNSLELDLHDGWPYISNQAVQLHLNSMKLLSKPEKWVTLEYHAVASANAEGGLLWLVDSPGTGHGLCLWFDAQLQDGVSFTSEPIIGSAVHGQMFLPWSEAVELRRGDEVLTNLSANLVDGRYIWRWDTEICRGSDPTRQTVASFQQSTYRGGIVIPTKLRKRSEQYKPMADRLGKAKAFILGMMNGEHSNAEIAAATHQRFADLIPTHRDALKLVAELSLRHGL